MFAVPELPPVIKRDKELEEKHKDAPVEDVKAPPNANHKIIILHTRLQDALFIRDYSECGRIQIEIDKLEREFNELKKIETKHKYLKYKLKYLQLKKIKNLQ